MDAQEFQYNLEVQADTEAAAKRLQELKEAAADGDTEVPRAARFIARMYAQIEENLRVFAEQRTCGNGSKYRSWLRALPLDVAAVIAARECIQRCSHSTYNQPVLVQSLGASIGKLWEMEVRIREAEAVNPVYMQRVHDQIKARGTRNEGHIRRTYNVAYERVMKGELDSALSRGDLLNVGKFGVDACLEAGLIVINRTTGKRGWLVHYTLAPEVEEFLNSYSDKDVALVTDKMRGGMYCPPVDWSTTSDGGYLTHRRKHAFPLMNIRKLRPNVRAQMYDEFTAATMPQVFECANYMQSQAFTIHGPTFAAIKRVWLSGGGVLGVPTKNGPQKPECPMGEDWVRDAGTEEELAAFTKWKREAAAYYELFKEWKGRVREIGGFMKVAEQYDGAVWFPVYCDTRGRWYYRGTPNPQGTDLAKGALHLHTKKALGHRGVFWLKVHIANSFGFDKPRFIDRARWTDENWATIERALDAPEDHPEVLGTDAPWCMFSAAWELREAYRSGSPETYQTGQIVHMDATCSGLQHFSAILRDPVGGLYVNLFDDVNCGPKQDIYAKVAANALQAIQRDLGGDDPAIKEIAAWWLSTGIPRGLAKKPVMTYVYGATLRGTARHIEDYIDNEMPEVQWPDPEKSYLTAQYAARKLFQGIAATVPAAENAMHWLREVARNQPKGQRMMWKVPTGFIVQHDYQSYSETRLRIRSCGMEYVVCKNFDGGTNPQQMQNAIAPNFVHALDACHLTMTVNRMKKLDLSIVGIHDSYGTHAGDVDTLHVQLREAFVELYDNRNLFGEFLWDINGIGEPPMLGTLDVRKVLESEFFFC